MATKTITINVSLATINPPKLNLASTSEDANGIEVDVEDGDTVEWQVVNNPSLSTTIEVSKITAISCTSTKDLFSPPSGTKPAPKAGTSNKIWVGVVGATPLNGDVENYTISFTTTGDTLKKTYIHDPKLKINN